MKTLIFKDYEVFLNRENKDDNGVSELFAQENPNYSEERNNKGCWDCRGCRDCSDCSDCSDCRGCSGCSGCRGCRGCSDCSDCIVCRDCSYCRVCRDCSDCRVCRGCSGCRGCREKNGEKQEIFKIPVIENIHQKILEAVSKKGALKMSDVHSCETTHCRAGWAVHLAGEEGYALEKQTDWAFAAMQIYKASSPIRVSPNKFYGSNESAMEDIARCAKEEAELNAKK